MTGSGRPQDKGGPQPEHQRKRAELRGPRHALIGALAVIAVAAITVGAMLMKRSDGGLVGLSLDTIAGSAFGSFRGPGAVLAVVIGGTQALAAALLVIDHRRGRHLAAVAAGLVIAFSVVLVMLMTRTTWLQPTLFGIGFIELLLVAGSTPRKPADRSRRFGRR